MSLDGLSAVSAANHATTSKKTGIYSQHSLVNGLVLVFKHFFMSFVIFMTEAFHHPEYYSATNQTAKLKPSVLVGLYKVVYVVKLLIG